LVRKAGLKNFFLKYVSHNFQLSTFYQNFRSIRRVLLGFLIGSKKRGRVPLNKIENEMNRRDKNRKYYYFFNYFIGFVKLMMEIKYAIFFFKRYAASMWSFYDFEGEGEGVGISFWDVWIRYELEECRYCSKTISMKFRVKYMVM